MFDFYIISILLLLLAGISLIFELPPKFFSKPNRLLSIFCFVCQTLLENVYLLTVHTFSKIFE